MWIVIVVVSGAIIITRIITTNAREVWKDEQNHKLAMKQIELEEIQQRQLTSRR